jgi:HSP20 family protein
MANIVRSNSLDHALDDLFRGFFVRPVGLNNNAERAGLITLDVAEKDNTYFVTAEIPGVKKEDIKISIDGPQVSICAERNGASELKDGERMLLKERHSGKVARSIELAQDIDEDRAEARFNDGVLELTLPKKAPVSARQLAIQ